MKSPLFYSQLFNALPTASLVVVPDYPTFTIIEVNDAFETLVQLPKDAIVGKGIFEALTDHGHKGESALAKAFLAVIQNKRPYKLALGKAEIAATNTGHTASRPYQGVITPLF